MPTQLTSEDRLILLSAGRPAFPRTTEMVLDLLGKSLDWNKVLSRAAEHEITPNLHAYWKTLQSANIPQHVQFDLDAKYRINALRNTFLSEELAAILVDLRAHGIPVILLKGLFLAQRIHGEWTSRVCADIDLLVPRAQLGSAYDLLQSRGYSAPYSREFLTDWITRNTYEFQMLRSTRQMAYSVELHCGLLWEDSPESDFMKAIWNSASDAEFLGATVLQMQAELEFLFLVIHAARHRWSCLKWLLDIHEIASRGNLNWSETKRLTGRLGWTGLVEQTLAISHHFLGTQVPGEFKMQPHQQLDEDLVNTYFTEPRIPTPMENTLLCMGLIRSKAAKFRFLLRRILVPTPREAAMCRLPGSLNFIYYLIRPVRLASGALADALGARSSKQAQIEK